jgi:hypothetical protein
MQELTTAPTLRGKQQKAPATIPRPGAGSVERLRTVLTPYHAAVQAAALEG